MIGAVLDHLWQSTLFALAIALAAAALGRAPSAFRHGLWLAASAKFLVPFAALEALGRLLAPPFRPRLAPAAGVQVFAEAAKPFSQALPPAPALHAALAVDPSLALLAVWALGCAVVLAAWWGPWARVRAALRSATPLAWPAPMPVLGSDAMLEPGLVGLWRPVLLVPATLFEHLARAEIAAIVAHESCHRRRRDNLTALLQMAVEALFWFHPLVWWIGGRLIEERERACDEAVVAAGHDRATYVRGLLECCRLYLQSPLPCVAGASGSELQARVRRIMTAPGSRPVPGAAKALLIAAGACAIATPVMAGLLVSPAAPEVSPLATVGIAAGVLRADVGQRESRLPDAKPAPRRNMASGRRQADHDAVASAPGTLGPALAEAAAPSRIVLAALDVPAPLAAPAILRTPAALPPELEIADESEAVAADSGRVVCRKEAITGTRFVKRICVTEGQWQEQQRRLFAFERERSLDPTGAAALPAGTDADDQ